MSRDVVAHEQNKEKRTTSNWDLMTLVEEEKTISGIPSRVGGALSLKFLLYFAFPQSVNFVKQSDGMISIT